MKAFVDADLLIWHLRGESRAAAYLASLRKSRELWTTAMQRAEVVFFMRPEHAEKTLYFLSQFRTVPVDAELTDAAAQLYRHWNPSHGIDINDAFLAAAAIKAGGEIHTLNRKHYPMPHLKVFKAW